MKRLLFTLVAAAGMVTNSQAQTSLDFDGNNDIVDVGTSLSNDLAGATSLSVEAWVNTSTTTGPFGVIVGNYYYPGPSPEMQFLLRRDNDEYLFQISEGGTSPFVKSGAATVIPGQWQHVVGTWDGTNMKIYIDGVEMGSNATGAISLRTTTNKVGVGGNAFNEFFTGQIDNIRIWSDARTETEINDFMNCEVTPNTPGLLASYHFNDGIESGTNTSNTLLFDNTGNGYHGTLQNFALTGTTSNFVASNRTNYMSIQAAIGSSAMADRMVGSEPADFNGDGFDDLLVSAESGARDIYYNDGLAHFETPTAVPNTIGGAFAVGDIDNDGDIDLVNYAGTNFKVYVNDGAGTFTEQAPISLNATGSISFARVADINGDNLADIILGNNGMNATDLNEIWINSGTAGNPAFTYFEGLNSTNAPINGIAVGDIDGDGDVDLAFGGGSWSALVFNNDNNTTFVQGQAISGYNGGVRFIDWNQDGHLDLVNNDSYNNWGVRVRYNDGTGSFDSNTTVIVLGTLNLLGQVEYADMNGDGFLDVISRHWGGNGRIYLSNGCVVTEETACQYKLGPADNNVVIGDFNSDGKTDVFCGARDRKSSVSLNFLDPVTTPALSNITSTTGDEVCDGDLISIEASVSNTGTIYWYDDVTGNTQIGTGSPYSPTNGPGIYTYYVQSENPNGCLSLMDSAEVIVNENPTATATTTDETMGSDGTIDLTVTGGTTGYTYSWTGPNNFTSTDEDLTGLVGGVYEVTITDANGCTFTTQVTVESVVGLNENSIEEFGLFPNPSNGTFTINTTVSGLVEIINANGQLIRAITIPNGKTEHHLTSLARGVYSVRLTTDNGVQIKKLVIQ